MNYKPPYDDSNWKEEYKSFVRSKYKLNLLDNGAKSLSQSWVLGAMYSDWKRKKGYNKFDPIENIGQLQSSFVEWARNLNNS